MSTTYHKCPNCGGEIFFDPITQSGKCTSCTSIFSVKELEDIREEKEKAYNTNFYSCPNCGAEIIADTTTTVTFCCYCNGPIILSDKMKGEFRPSKIIPFKITKENAIEEFLKWSKKKWFVPNEFKSYKQLEKISGVYVPFWLVDSDINTDVIAEAKKVKTWSSGDYRYTKTDIYHVYRTAKIEFDKVPGNASTKANDEIMESIEPFNKEEIRDFSMSYLPGFIADNYDKSKEKVLPKVKNKIDNIAKNIVTNSITGYSSVSVIRRSIDFEKTECEYALLPIWMLIYSHNGKNYTFAMNGETGKVFGELPISKIKLLIMFIIVTIITFGILFGGGLFIW